RGLAPIGGDQVVQVHLGQAPVPHAHDHVALDALRALRLHLRQLAGRDAVRPLGEQLERWLGAEDADVADHGALRLPGLDAPDPGLVAVAVVKLPLDRASRLIAHLVATDAAVRLDAIEPHGLTLDGGRDAVATLACA